MFGYVKIIAEHQVSSVCKVAALLCCFSTTCPLPQGGLSAWGAPVCSMVYQQVFYTIFPGSVGQGIAEDTAGSRRHCLVVQFSSARKCSSGICNQLAGLWNWSMEFGSCNKLLIPLLSSSFFPLNALDGRKDFCLHGSTLPGLGKCLELRYRSLEVWGRATRTSFFFLFLSSIQWCQFKDYSLWSTEQV